MTANQISVIELIKNRLPSAIFDYSQPAHLAKMEMRAAECFSEMDICFGVRFVLNSSNETISDWSRVGNESLYNPLQKSLIADFCVYRFLIDYLISFNAISVNSLQSEEPRTFVKKAQAGSANVEFGLIEAKDNSMFLKASELANSVMSDVMRKGRALGCLIDVNKDGVYKIEIESALLEYPMLNIKSCGCC